MVLRPIDRREFVLLGASSAFAACSSTPGMGTPTRSAAGAALANLERGGRLGVAILDTGSGTCDGHRVDERFAMCSTFKLVLAAMVLERAATGGRPLDATVRLTRADLMHHAPVTEALLRKADGGSAHCVDVALETLAHAAQTVSDNPAANVLLRDFGGPAAVTAFCRAHGDAITRLDRMEPEMNDVRGGDVRDTTTPRAMAHLLAHLLGSNGLAPSARATLRQWMIDTETGAARVRAGLPAQWVAGDKTGTGGGGGNTMKVNDVVWIEPPGRAPLVVAAYYDNGIVAESPTDADLAVLAEVGRIVARGWGG